MDNLQSAATVQNKRWGKISLFFSSNAGDNILGYYKGLWQRITLLNTYAYFFVIAIMMVRPAHQNEA